MKMLRKKIQHLRGGKKKKESYATASGVSKILWSGWATAFDVLSGMGVMSNWTCSAF